MDSPVSRHPEVLTQIDVGLLEQTIHEDDGLEHAARVIVILDTLIVQLDHDLLVIAIAVIASYLWQGK